METEPQLLPLKDGWREREFERVYSQLYADEASLRKAMPHHKSYGFPYVERDNSHRMEDLKFWLDPGKDYKDHYEYTKTHQYKRPRSSFLFSDVKEIVGDFPVDVAFLSLGVGEMNPFGNPKGTILKCIQGMKNNDIRPGNFARVLWNRGMCYYDAMEDRMTGQKPEFEVILKEPTYDRPTLVITERFDEGRMLGSYLHFLGSKGIGAYAAEKRGIPGFSFIANDYSRGWFSMVNDSLDYF